MIAEKKCKKLALEEWRIKNGIISNIGWTSV